MKATRKTPIERFWSFVRVGDSDCWEWTGGKDYDGYGIFSAEGRSWRAHRWAYESMVASIPSGLVIDHLCRNRACVNPDHLEPVTHRVNILRGVAPPARNAVATHCVNGHKLGARRKCGTCQALIQRRRAGWAEERIAAIPIAAPPSERTHCPQGHEYDDANTWFDKHGKRHCRTCHRERERARYRAKKGLTP